MYLLFFPQLAIAEEEQIIGDTDLSLDEIRVIGKFTNKTAAEKLLRSLNKTGQPARIISQTEDITLKSVNVGLYPDKSEAASVERHLKSHDIDAFMFPTGSGEYRVHAGALRGEDQYWSRFEKLLALGYKRIHTTLKPVTITHFFVVRELIEDLPPPMYSLAVDSEERSKTFKTTFLFGRFKGEFDGWRASGEQSSSNYFRASLSARTFYKKQWDFTYGLRFDALEQSSTNNIQKFEFQALPTYLRYQEPNNQWHVGLIDGRWDDRKQASLGDRLSSRILTRHLLDEDVIDRRRPIIGARWQFEQAQYRLDVIASPIFRPAQMPTMGSIWHPINRENKAIMGLRSTDIWKDLVSKGSFADEKKYQIGGVGVRMSQQVGRRTRATTIQYIRQSEPYYQLNAEIQQLISNGNTVDEALAASSNSTFSPRHPYSAVFTWEEFGKVSHFEVAVSSNTPYTTTTYEMKSAVSLEWMLGFVYPTKDRLMHISSYFVGRRINTKDNILDRKTKLGIKGDLYKYSKGRHWKVGSAYQINFDQLSLFLNPRIDYVQNKYLDISLYYQLFVGSNNDSIGFHSDHSILGLRWQAVF